MFNSKNIFNMKKIINILIVGVMLVSLVGCADDYLDTVPTNSTATPTVFENTENAAMAINGICKTMNRQYLGTQGMNGEGTIKMYYGNYPGNDFMVNLPGWAPLIIPTYHTNSTSSYDYYPWYYYYRLVGDANTILANIDGAAGPDAEKQFIKAQAYSFRAYAFTQLAQLYCYRWQDSNNGASNGLVLRTTATIDAMPLSTLADTYTQIYEDLDEAIDLYKKSGITREENYLPSIGMAYATYARAAINKQDYPKAIEMAKHAREGHPLMSVAEYKDGFYDVNKEWIWSSDGRTTETLYYYSYHAYISYNSNAGAVRTTPKCISKDLYETIASTDIRKGLFLDPLLVGADSYSKTTGAALTTGTGPALKAKAFELFPKLDATASVFAYMQFKIANRDNPGVGDMNHFRSSEMYIIEAEAEYKQNNATKAQQLLVELTKDSGRDPSYSCSLTGDALFSEIKRVAQIELWGEGLDWFMMKRWGDKIVHKHFRDGGNFPTSCDGEVLPDGANKWTWVIPVRETDYNDLIVL
jgi:hypothetical protein